MGKEVDRPKVALIGRPNVGKSTLYNRLTGRRQAIVDELPGVTRDRLYGTCEWDGYELTIIDCGGMGSESEDPLWEPVAENSRQAMREADAIILVADARTGMTLSDDEVVKDLRKLKKPVVVAVNKVESPKFEPDAYEFYSMGYQDIYFVSALAGYNIGDVLDRVIEMLDWEKWPKATPEYVAWRYGGEPDPEDETPQSSEPSITDDELDDLELDEEDYPFAWAKDNRPRFIADESWRDDPVRLVFAGRQNAGKSSLTNALLGEHRSLVADLPGTTRDPLFAEFKRDGQRFELLDTAGIKRISRLKQDVDYYSLIRAEKGLRTSEVALLTIDGSIGLVEQDRRVASKIEESGLAIVIVVNKCDLLKSADGHSAPGEMELSTYRDYVYGELAKLKWAEIVFTSAVKGIGLDELCNAALRARENFHRRIDNIALKAVLEEAIVLNPPPIVKNRELRFNDFRQIGNCPPTFLVEANDKKIIRTAYKRFLSNTIRKHFELRGTHIQLVYYTRRSRRNRRKK